jgi:phosphatidate cytidylyltransferase
MMAELSGDAAVRAFSGVVGVALVLASLVLAGLQKVCPERDFSQIWLKIRSWAIIAGGFLGALLLGGVFPHLWLAFISFASLREYFTIIPTSRSDRGAILWSYLMIPLQSYLVAHGSPAANLIPLFILLIVPVRQLLVGETVHYVDRTSRIVWGSLLMVYGLGHTARLLGPDFPQAAHSGTAMLLYLAFLTAINDVGAFLCGKSLGHQRISPNVSPNKTWAGFLGGLLVCTALAVVLAPIAGFTFVQGALAGLLIGIAGFFGDLTVSAIKRDLGIKDSGSSIPGHGGVLDRVDSLVLSAPIFVLFVQTVLR